MVIWAKIIEGERVAKSILYRREEKYDGGEFHSYLSEICAQLDCPTPVILKSHISNYETFNSTRFKQRDFLEPVLFESLVLEFAG